MHSSGYLEYSDSKNGLCFEMASTSVTAEKTFVEKEVLSLRPVFSVLKTLLNDSMPASMLTPHIQTERATDCPRRLSYTTESSGVTQQAMSDLSGHHLCFSGSLSSGPWQRLELNMVDTEYRFTGLKAGCPGNQLAHYDSSCPLTEEPFMLAECI